MLQQVIGLSKKSNECGENALRTASFNKLHVNKNAGEPPRLYCRRITVLRQERKAKIR